MACEIHPAHLTGNETEEQLLRLAFDTLPRSSECLCFDQILYRIKNINQLVPKQQKTLLQAAKDCPGDEVDAIASIKAHPSFIEEASPLDPAPSIQGIQVHPSFLDASFREPAPSIPSTPTPAAQMSSTEVDCWAWFYGGWFFLSIICLAFFPFDVLSDPFDIMFGSFCLVGTIYGGLIWCGILRERRKDGETSDKGDSASQNSQSPDANPERGEPIVISERLSRRQLDRQYEHSPGYNDWEAGERSICEICSILSFVIFNVLFWWFVFAAGAWETPFDLPEIVILQILVFLCVSGMVCSCLDNFVEKGGWRETNHSHTEIYGAGQGL